ncbi:MAG: metallophosphoesterase family protein [Flavobacteriales bacterium]|nr:metallophosphoesterase family protein [Flavobacteriales bacterium]
MKKIGVISDTHGHIDPKYEKYFGSCDEIWHAGDIGDLAVTDYLKTIAPVRGVYGNIDNHIIRTEFPLHQKFYCEEVRVWMTHIGGKPYAYSRYVIPEINVSPPRLFICGHSHICKVQMDKRLGMLYVNPGAAGVKGFHKVRTLIRFEIDGPNMKNMEVIELGTR